MSQLTKEQARVCYLTALTLTLSIVENSLPHPLPFLRLGLANLALLYALTSLNTKDYFLVCLLKWFLSSLLSGLLFSPFALLSLASTASSGIVMFLSHRLLGKWISNYGISTLGASASGVSQIALSSLILSPTVFALLPLMLLFSIISAVIIAFISTRLEPRLEDISISTTEDGEQKKDYLPLVSYIPVFLLVIFSSSLPALCAVFILSLVLAKVCGRRIRVLPYLFSFVFIVVFNLFSPQGKVLFGFITEGALLVGLQRALTLITLAALSQSLSRLSFTSSPRISAVLAVYGELCGVFFSAEGKLGARVKEALNRTNFESRAKDRKELKRGKIIIINLLSLLFLVCPFVI